MTAKGSKLFKGKMQALVSIGLGKANVHRFIKDKSIALTMAGVRNAKNVPNEFERRVEFIATLLEHPEHAAIFLDWIAEHKVLEATIEATDAIHQLAAMEPKSAIGPGHEHLWRSILFSLAANPNSMEIRAFLNDVPKEPTHGSDKPEKGEGRRELDEALRVANGEPVAEPKDPLLTTFITGIAAIVEGNQDAVEKAFGELGSNSKPVAKQYAALFEALLQRRLGARLGRAGLEVRDSRRSLPAGISRQEQYQVLGRMISPIAPGHRFFDIFAVIHEGGVHKLGKAEAESLFPRRGSAILFASKAAGQVVPVGSEWILTLKLIDETHDHASQYEVASIDRRLSEVLPINHKSSEPDKIRAAISSYRPSASAAPVFELADGYLLPMGSFPPNFAEPIGYLEALVAYELDGRKLVVDGIGTADSFLDCSPPELSIKRLFKARSELDGIPQITKAQVARLADLAASEANDGCLGSSIRRAKGHVDDLLATKEEISLVVQELLATPTVNASLEAEKQRILAEFETSLEGHRQEMGALLGKKEQLEAGIKKLHEQQQAQASRLAEQIRGAFEKATGDGAKLLSSVALLAPFMRDKPEMARDDALPTIKASGTPAREATAILGGIVGFAHKHGLPQTVLCQVIASSIANGLVGLSGKATPLFQQAIAVTLAGKLSVTISLSGDMFGWSDVLNAPVSTSLQGYPAMTLGEFIALTQRSKVPVHVSIVGANRIPPESYMDELLSVAGFGGIGNAISWRRFDGKLCSARLVMPVFFSLTCVNGKSTFQISPPLAQILPFINCDADWDKRSPPNAGMQFNATYVEMGNHNDHAKGGFQFLAENTHSFSVADAIESILTGWAVPDGDARMLAGLSLKLGRVSREVLESEASHLQGGLGERFLAYVRHESNEQISEIFATAGERGK